LINHHISCRFLFAFLMTLLLSLFSLEGWSGEQTRDAKGEVRSQYKPILKLVNQNFPANQAAFDSDKRLLAEFIEQHVREYWDASSTTRALIGKEAFQSLTQEQKGSLVKAVDQTLVRYAIETYRFYNGHHFHLNDIFLSRSGKMGWLKILMESPRLPDLNLEILIKRNQQGDWKAVDVRFMGITYVAIKKHQYRRLFKKRGVEGLIDNLNAKNRTFFSEF
jgi:ABC-type transporter MlaC component